MYRPVASSVRGDELLLFGRLWRQNAGWKTYKEERLSVDLSDMLLTEGKRMGGQSL